VRGQEIHAFSQSVLTAQRLGLANARLVAFVGGNARKLNDAIAVERDREFEYFGLRTVYDRYLLRHPQTRLVIETPQQFFLRIACALSGSVPEALELYRLFSTLQYLPSSPTLFNAGTRHEQLSSCFLLDSPEDHLAGIYQKYTDAALLSKFSGGIGLAYHRVRSRGSLIESTNGHSNGVVPWLKTLDASVAAVIRAASARGRAASTSRAGTPTSRTSSRCATTRCPSWICRTSRRSPTSSSGASRPTRSASSATSPSDPARRQLAGS
jgi:ribonucleoside-diphosphate reductase alpha chain